MDVPEAEAVAEAEAEGVHRMSEAAAQAVRTMSGEAEAGTKAEGVHIYLIMSGGSRSGSKSGRGTYNG